MADNAHKKTDKMILKLEKDIKKEYRQAFAEIDKKLKEHESLFMMENEAKKQTLSPRKYNKYIQEQVMRTAQWHALRHQMAKDYRKAYDKAKSITSGYMKDAYALNMNYTMYGVEHDAMVRTAFTLYDRHTVEKLLKDNPSLLPIPSPEKLEKMGNKFERWTEAKLSSAVTQSILQGESIDKLAGRLKSIGNMSTGSSIRNARTAMTSAQNSGRMDAMHYAESQGIQLQKQWLATLDDRTRHEHRELDGQVVDIDEPFVVDGEEIMFPADPECDDPALIYNCRCTMIQHMVGFAKKVVDVDTNPKMAGMSYDEWKHGRDDEDIYIPF